MGQAGQGVGGQGRLTPNLFQIYLAEHAKLPNSMFFPSANDRANIEPVPPQRNLNR